MHRIDALEVSLEGKLVGHVHKDGEERVGDIADGQRKHGDGHSQGNCRLGTLTELNREGAGEHAANRLVRRNVGADRDRAHEQQLQARTYGEASLQVTQHQAHERAQDDGAERVEGAELIVEAAKSSD